MFDFHEKRKIRSLVYSKVSIGAILLVTIVLSFSVFERFSIERDMAEKRDVRKEELEQLKQRAGSLEAKVKHLQDDRGIEEEIRGRFDVAKEGERVVIILEDEKTASRTPVSSDGQSKDDEGADGSWLSTLKFW
jgi:cell division protein FtsB